MLPLEVHNQQDFGYRIENQSVVLIEIRPQRNNPEIIREMPLAKTTSIKSHKLWKTCWQRQDLKWHAYDPVPEVKYF